MHLSQAALSGLIKELENRVGVRLLDRTTRKVSASGGRRDLCPDGAARAQTWTRRSTT